MAIGLTSIANNGVATIGTISVETTGTVSATGSNSVGIYAWADTTSTDGTASEGDISINVRSGSVTGGTGTGSGVRIDSSGNNTLINSGNISALSNLAIFGGDGAEAVANSGLVIGNVDLAGGTNRFTNEVGGTFRTLAYANVGTLTNHGDRASLRPRLKACRD